MNKSLVSAVIGLIKANQHIAPGAVPGAVTMGRYGLFIEFAYPVVIEGQCQHDTYDIFDLMKEAEESHEPKNW